MDIKDLTIKICRHAKSKQNNGCLTAMEFGDFCIPLAEGAEQDASQVGREESARQTKQSILGASSALSTCSTSQINYGLRSVNRRLGLIIDIFDELLKSPSLATRRDSICL